MNASTSSAEALTKRQEGNEHYKHKRYNKAIQCYTQALEHCVQPVTLSNRAQAYLNLNSFERALSDATEALRLEPSLEKALYRRACALEKMELFGRARLDLQHLLDVNANSDDAKQMLKRLQGKADTQEYKLTCFTKTESLQSESRLSNVKVEEM